MAQDSNCYSYVAINPKRKMSSYWMATHVKCVDCTRFQQVHWWQGKRKSRLALKVESFFSYIGPSIADTAYARDPAHQPSTGSTPGDSLEYFRRTKNILQRCPHGSTGATAASGKQEITIFEQNRGFTAQLKQSPPNGPHLLKRKPCRPSLGPSNLCPGSD